MSTPLSTTETLFAGQAKDGTVCLVQLGRKNRRIAVAIPASRPAGAAAHATYSIRAGKVATVVVVDDDPSVLRALSRLIQTAGFRVLAFDRPSALIASEIPKADACLIVDLNLPEMNGSELCSALTASGRGLPAILITGRDDSATQRLIKGTHPVAVLLKPVDERALFDAITRALAPQ
jgi:CheY-like chemotaxis protein